MRTLAAALLCAICIGCSSKIEMMPTPVLYQGGQLNVFKITPPDKQSNTLEVFYATQRVGKGKADDRDYGNKFGDKLSVGKATVQFGDAKTTWPQLVEASQAQKRKKQINLKLKGAREIGSLSPQSGKTTNAALTPGERAFADEINRALADVMQPEINIYVHGFSVDFERSAAFAAQMRHFLGRRQVVMVYAWPCGQRMVGYYGDGAKAVKSGPKLADLIEFLAANTKAEHINILGYSAGATVVVEGIYALRDRHPEMDAAALQKNFRVGNVLLTGADVDLKHFVRKQFARVIDVPEYLQITVSSRDSAMSMSKMLHGGSRLGRANAKELKREEIEQLAKSTKLQVINVTDVKGAHDAAGGFGGHGYWYANPWVSSDVLTMFIWQLPPDQRGLVHVPGKKTWMYPDDYPDRLRAMVTEQVRRMREKQGTPTTSTAGGQAGAEAR